MAALTAGLTAQAALSNLHGLDGPLLQLLLSCSPEKEGMRRRREERKKRERKKQRKLICRVQDLNLI